MNIPGTLAAGDSLTWHDDAAKDNLGNAITSEYWTLSYHLRGTQSLDLTSVSNGPGWSTTISTTQSAALTAGVFYWQAAVTNGGERMTLGSGQIKITPNLSAASAGYDGRTQAEQALDAINAEIQARLTGGMAEEYTIGQRSLKKTPMRDLLEMQSRYKSIVARERQASQIAQGLGNPRALYVRF